MSSQAPVQAVTIIGFGLIGASLANALVARDPKVRIHGVDTTEVVALARDTPEVATLTDVADTHALERRLAESELTVLAGPVSVIVEQLNSAIQASNICTDCGSTKRVIVERAASCPDAARFVPGHPMAGRSRGGFAAARADLFEGRPWILCPTASNAESLRVVEQLVRFVGAKPVTMTADQHDAAVAVTSHVPKLLAGMLSAMCVERGAQAVQGPAFHRVTQAAGEATGIWQDILESNADEVARAARALGNELERVADELERGDLSAAGRILRQQRPDE